MRHWIGEKLRRWADRIDHEGAPKAVVEGDALALRGPFVEYPPKGEAVLEREVFRYTFGCYPEDVVAGRRPFVDYGPGERS